MELPVVIAGLALNALSVIIAAIFIAFIFLGIPHVSSVLLPFFAPTIVTSLFLVMLALLIAPFVRARMLAGALIVILSVPFGVASWFFSSVTVYWSWGWTGVVISSLFMIAGIVPASVIVAIFHEKDGLMAFALVVMPAISVGFRFLGFWLLHSAEAALDRAREKRISSLEREHSDLRNG